MDKKNKVLIDLTYLQEVASDNTDFMVEMIDIFLAQTPDYISILQDAIASEDLPKIAEMAHKIKPTLAFMGANEAKEAMGFIEHRARIKEDYNGIVTDFKQLSADFGDIILGLQEKRKELLAKG